MEEQIISGEHREKKGRRGTKAVLFFTVMFLAVLIGVLYRPVLSRLQINKINRQICLGVKYLNEMDYETAVIAFENVIKIDEKTVVAYMGLALAYEKLGETEKAIEVLKRGVDTTEGEILKIILSDLQAGKQVGSIYDIVDLSHQEGKSIKLRIDDSPFNKLKIFGEKYYYWDIVSCVGAFDLDYKEYEGERLDLGEYQDFKITLDNMKQRPEIVFAKDGYSYAYQYFEKSQQQSFRIQSEKMEGVFPKLSGIKTEIDLRMSEEQILRLTGLEQLDELKENVYYIVKSNLGWVGVITWQEDQKTHLSMFLASEEGLWMNLTFQDSRLQDIVYGCDIPQNMKSKLLTWMIDKVV